jgi:hypothetical protein
MIVREEGGWGSQRHTNLKGKRGKMRTRPPADRSACCEPNLSVEGKGLRRHYSQNAKNMPSGAIIFLYKYEYLKIKTDYKILNLGN